MAIHLHVILGFQLCMWCVCVCVCVFQLSDSWNHLELVFKETPNSDSSVVK